MNEIDIIINIKLKKFCIIISLLKIFSRNRTKIYIAVNSIENTEILNFKNFYRC